ncbi:MAG: tRNA (N6-threonylcarbamoyladenosine(37)-N6)-methyltransferase TrmO [Spirochaetes bacterium]|nr:tRNA (N6-threonylcarbamoyladenosine(37)-N6)-methyltransferase TrmO [Spirochaetota bacterium]
MMTVLDCVPCLLRQAVEASRFLSADGALQEKIMHDMLHALYEADFSVPPPVLAQQMHRRMRAISGVDDPYRLIKDRFNAMALAMIDGLTEEINGSADPMVAAIKLAIAGNVIDCGAKTGLSEDDVTGLIHGSASEDLAGDIDNFLRAVESAENILYIADNAGEIVFDRPLLEKLGPERVTFAVRGFPVINDATMRDARAAGLDAIVKVIENGSDAPGTVLEECSDEFRRRFEEADLVIAKGQGNYETLCDVEKPVFFLFKVKCPIVADHTGFPVGTHAVIQSTQTASQGGTAAPSKQKTGPAVIRYTPIGFIRSEHKNPSETPIQPMYAKGCRGHAEILPEYAEGLEDLSGFSHIYILYHLHRAGPHRLLVKPFLDSAERGLFSTRHPFRPNPIGLSIVELLGVRGNTLDLDGLDILDGTPILDIKPYSARFDRIEATRNGWQDTVSDARAAEKGIRNYKKK